MTMLTFNSEIPYFGEHVQITVLCESCGWKHTDFIPSEGSKPGFWTLTVDSPEKISARVVRSSACTIRIPQLDLEVSPGGSSSGYITNIEGVLNRFSETVKSIIRSSDDSEGSVEVARGILNDLSRVIEGSNSIDLVLLDPQGRSQIIHEEARCRELDEEELAELESLSANPIIEFK